MDQEEENAPNPQKQPKKLLTKLPIGEGSLLCHEVEGELVMYQYGTDVVHRLNPTARMIWESLDTSKTDKEIVDQIADLYQLPIDEVRDDVEALLGALHQKGLILESAPGKLASDGLVPSSAQTRTAGPDATDLTSSRRSFLRRGLKGVAALTYAVPVIETLILSEAHAQGPPSQITNEPPPPTSDPVITSISPDNADTGKNLTVNVYGFDFLSGFTSDFGSQISISKNTWKNPNWVTVKIKVDKKASAGGRIVTITNPNTEFDTFCCFTVN